MADLRALLALSLLLSIYYAVKVGTSRLKTLPGPLVARLSAYYRVWLLSTGKGPVKYLELHRDYGPVVRTGPNHVSLSDPALIPKIYDLKGKFAKVSLDQSILSGLMFT